MDVPTALRYLLYILVFGLLIYLWQTCDSILIINVNMHVQGSQMPENALHRLFSKIDNPH